MQTFLHRISSMYFSLFFSISMCMCYWPPHCAAVRRDVTPAAAMETGALLLQVQGCGTVCQLIWDKLTLTLNSFSGS